jgi:hypothetical protein
VDTVDNMRVIAVDLVINVGADINDIGANGHGANETLRTLLRCCNDSGRRDVTQE